MKTAEQISEEIYAEYENARDNIILTPEGYKLDLIRAIKADRAQCEHPMSDPLIELREWASTVSQFMAEDKSNDWSEEIAQLQVIEERMDGEA